MNFELVIYERDKSGKILKDKDGKYKKLMKASDKAEDLMFFLSKNLPKCLWASNGIEGGNFKKRGA